VVGIDKPTLLATVLGLSMAIGIIHRSRLEYWRWNNPVDLAMCLAACFWLFHMVALETLRQLGADERALLVALCIRDQTLTVAVAMLLIGLSNNGRRRTYRYLLVQMGTGCAALTWMLVIDGDAAGIGASRAYRCWIIVNLSGSAALAWSLARRARHRPSVSNGLAFVAIALVCVLWTDGLQPGEVEVVPATFTKFTHLFYAMCLTFMWYLSKLPAANSPLPSSDIAPTSGFDVVSGFAPGSAETTRLISQERRRIAHDLHDNVGSQLVNILASLRAPGAADQSLSVALEQCLQDLKMTVDAIDSVDDNVPEALGRVRQRAQPALDALGIQMTWRVQMCDQLEAARGQIAVQILRIAQEALTNIIRHSGATAVEIACRYDRPSREIILEIYDNGHGIAPGAQHGRAGRGLKNMRQRAAAVQGHLFISTKARKGTHLRLSVPFDMRSPPRQHAQMSG
jgi:signal transduction histidine kinase